MSSVFHWAHTGQFLFDTLVVVVENENSIDNPLFSIIKWYINEPQVKA